MDKHAPQIATPSSLSPARARRPALIDQVTETTVSGSSGIAPRRVYMCECCPKKPKRFDNEEELKIHMMEKQYKCGYCRNRFKNKNEAEQHENSLHLRRYSWSCAAISGYEAAFHPSTSPASQTTNGPSGDACGFCGREFPNFPRDSHSRIEHLTNLHNFQECKQTKFFRADHFQQHLKHSHTGTSGKWTNMLVNACMKEELAVDAPGGAIMEAGEPVTEFTTSAQIESVTSTCS
ncbi:hypothetical protein GJ744_002080 [Endocarpon pusillum]|uniref:C2H2-type domain-containing protein n=1 Tax=Endocarpon pusillum TaxID=364733 RepID=A0A8H7A8H2_9EURO|nr:hypothetical protein GJ744_002080 [Endocarpon pusillum]